MPTLKQTDSSKWIQGVLATVSMISGYLLFLLMNQIGEWADFEAKMAGYQWVSQGVALLGALGIFVWGYRRKDIQQYLDEVFAEVLKVVWPDRASTTRLTIGILIAVFITSVILGTVDFIIGKLLGLLYKL